MSARVVRYVWKIPKPKDPKVASALMAAAYKTAIETNPNTKEILIRSTIHASTGTRGQYRADQPHITIAAKDEQQRQKEHHESSHGYTPSIKSTEVIKVAPSGYSKPDDTLDYKGKPIWPKGLPFEDVTHNDK